MTAPSDIIRVSLEKILPLTYPAILTVPLKDKFPSNLQPSSIIAQISFFLLRGLLQEIISSDKKIYH